MNESTKRNILAGAVAGFAILVLVIVGASALGVLAGAAAFIGKFF